MNIGRLMVGIISALSMGGLLANPLGDSVAILGGVIPGTATNAATLQPTIAGQYCCNRSGCHKCAGYGFLGDVVAAPGIGAGTIVNYITGDPSVAGQICCEDYPDEPECIVCKKRAQEDDDSDNENDDDENQTN